MHDDERTCRRCGKIIVCDLTRGWISVRYYNTNPVTRLQTPAYTRFCPREKGAVKHEHSPIPLNDPVKMEEWLQS